MTLLLLLSCSFVLEDEPCSPDTGLSAPDTAADSGDSALDSAVDSACESSELYADADGDGYGDPERVEDRCPTEGWVAEAGDCNDADAAVFPGALERCNGTSDACDAAWVNDDGLATLTDTLGVRDATAELAGADGAPAVAVYDVSSLALCAGTWFVNLRFTGGGVVAGVGEGVVLDGGGGGAVLELGVGDYVLSDLTVRNGAGVSGGGISVNGADTLTITDLLVEANSAKDGGGLSLGAPTVATVSNSAFSGNAATDDGGGIAISGGSLTLTNTTVSANTSGGVGGGIAGLPGAGSQVFLLASTVSGNHADGLGGGVYAEDMALTCTGDAAAAGVGVLENESGTKGNELRVAGRSATVVAEACDLAPSESGPLGIVSVEDDSDYSYGPDATFSCDSSGCVEP